MAATDPRTGLVIAGAGARGAYEIGALSVLVPWLRRRGEFPRVLVGTSAGGMNAVLAAAMIEQPDPEEAAESALALWRGLGCRGVFRPLALTAPVSVLSYLAGIVGLPGGLRSLLDPAPLRETLEAFDGWDALHSAVGAGTVEAVAVATTAMNRARTEVFVELAPGVRPPPDDSVRGVVHVPARLGTEHLMASAAIPAAFPPVRIDDGWYIDGGVRLNAPIRPAMRLGVDRLVVVATHPLEHGYEPVPSGDEAPHGAPDVFSTSGTVLSAVLVDRMVEDVRSVQRVNRLLGARVSGHGYRKVPVVFCGPPRGDTIAQVAVDVLEERYEGLPGVLSLLGADYAVLNRIVGGNSRTHAELLSFLLFDPAFVDRLIELGRRDASAVVEAAGPDPWSAPVRPRD